MSTSIPVYNPAFVAHVNKVLADKTAAGPVARAILCQTFGLAKGKERLFSDLLADGLLPDYEGVQGKHGGIGRKGVARAPGMSGRLDAAFVTLLCSAMEKLVPVGSTRIVTRGDVAREMGIPCGETEQRISLALSEKLLPGFTSKRGSGIFRDSEFVAPSSESLSSDGENEPEEAAAEAAPAEAAPAEAAPAEEPQPEVDAAPATPKKAKSKSKK